MNYKLYRHFRGNFVFQIFIYCILFETYLSAPIKVNYKTFLEDIKREKCSFPNEVILPFESSNTTFEFLSEPLSVCKDPESTKRSKEAIRICSEVFGTLKNITCHSNNNLASNKIDIEFSNDVCTDISFLQFSKPEDSEKLLKHLGDKLICDMMCDDEFKSACQVLLWSFLVEQRILTAIKDQDAGIKKFTKEEISMNIVKDNNNSNKDQNNGIKSISQAEFNNMNVVKDNINNDKNLNDGIKSVSPSDINNINIGKDNNIGKNLDAGIESISQADINKDVVNDNINNDKDGKGTLIQPDITLNAIDKNEIVVPNKLNELNDMKLKSDTSVKVQNIDSVKINAKNDLKNVESKPKNIDDKNTDLTKTNDTRNELDNMDLKPNNLDVINRVSVIKTNDIDQPNNDNQVKTGSKNVSTDESNNENNKEQQDNLDLENSSVIPGEDYADQRIINQPVDIKNGKIKDNTEKLKTKSSDVKPEFGKKEQDEAKKVTNSVQITAPEIPSIETDKQTGLKQESKVPDISEDKALEPASSEGDLLPVTTMADLEKMEGENEIPESIGKDQDPYNDMESESEYNKLDYDGDDGLFDPLKNQKPNRDETDNVKEQPEPAMKVNENIYKPINSIGRQSDEIDVIPAFPEQEDSHFFFYFLSIVFFLMGGYILFHNKQKIIALIVEGRHERRRRSHGVGYKKLETK